MFPSRFHVPPGDLRKGHHDLNRHPTYPFVTQKSSQANNYPQISQITADGNWATSGSCVHLRITCGGLVIAGVPQREIRSPTGLQVCKLRLWFVQEFLEVVSEAERRRSKSSFGVAQSLAQHCGVRLRGMAGTVSGRRGNCLGLLPR